MNHFDLVREAARSAGIEQTVLPDFLELYRAVMKDQRPRLELAYIFSETKDNQLSPFSAAQRLLKQDLAQNFLIIDGAEANGFPGFKNWKRSLEGIVGQVTPVPISDKYGVNTKSESDAVVAFAKREGTAEMYATAALFHQLRAYMTLVSSVMQTGSGLAVYSKPGLKLPWTETVAHSQGILVATRAELVGHEIGRIKRYQAKGDILPAREILDYMGKRKQQRL